MEKELKRLVNEEILLTKFGRYYINLKKRKHLGFRDDTLEYLKALNITLADVTLPEQLVRMGDKSKQSEALNNQPIPANADLVKDCLAPSQEKDEYSDLLGTISDINIDSSSGGDLDIFCNGINQLRSDCRCPVLIIWDKEEYIMDAGNGQKKINTKTVLSKTIHNKIIDTYKITFKRDDSPCLDHYSHGKLIATVVKKQQYNDKLEFQRNRVNRASLTHEKQRNEFSRNIAQSHDVEALAKGYAGANNNDRSMSKSSFRDVDAVLAKDISETEKSGMLDSLMIQTGIAPAGF